VSKMEEWDGVFISGQWWAEWVTNTLNAPIRERADALDGREQGVRVPFAQVVTDEPQPETVLTTTPPPDHADWERSQALSTEATQTLIAKRRKSAEPPRVSERGGGPEDVFAQEAASDLRDVAAIRRGGRLLVPACHDCDEPGKCIRFGCGKAACYDTGITKAQAERKALGEQP
jgi:hypothetical protein